MRLKSRGRDLVRIGLSLDRYLTTSHGPIETSLNSVQHLNAVCGSSTLHYVSVYEKVVPSVKCPTPLEAICPLISQWLVHPRLIRRCQPPSIRRLSGRNKLNVGEFGHSNQEHQNPGTVSICSLRLKRCRMASFTRSMGMRPSAGILPFDVRHLL